MDYSLFKTSSIPIVEIFTSISGEGISSGQIVTFVRSAGCNLRCNYCDTTYSYDENITENINMTPNEVVEKLNSLGVKNIICTGGEPLEEDKPKRLLPLYIASCGYNVRIETNGSCKLYSKEEVEYFSNEVIPEFFYVLDVKCPDSGMTNYDMIHYNINNLKKGDELKFVVSSKRDMEFAIDTLRTHNSYLSLNQVVINFSPVFDRINPRDLVKMLIEQNVFFNEYSLNARLSLQIHKYIWSPDTKGV